MAASGASDLQPDIEDVFAVTPYGGDYKASTAGSDRTIPDDTNIATYGGMVWIRSGGTSGMYHATGTTCWFDTDRGADKALYISDNNYAQQTITNSIDFTTNGILVGQPAGNPSNNNYPEDPSGNEVDFNYGETRAYNANIKSYQMYTFRKHPKFFDFVTISHNSSSSTTVNLNLENPGYVVVKAYDLSSNADSWCWHKDFDAGKLAKLNTQDYPFASSVFTVSNNTVTLSTGLPTGNYVIAAWNHDPSPTGLIQCFKLANNSGTYPTGTTPYQDLGWMPQWVLSKRNDSQNDDWIVQDYQLGMGQGGRAQKVSRGIAVGSYGSEITAKIHFYNGGKEMYHSYYAETVFVAIRRGPMKQPTAATKVYYGQTAYLPSTQASLDPWSNWKTTFFSGWPVDFAIRRTNWASSDMTGPAWNSFLYRYRRQSDGTTANQLVNNLDYARNQGTASNQAIYNPTGLDGNFGGFANYGSQFLGLMFREYPEIFNVTYYKGDGTNTRNIEHNLGVAPEWIIFHPLEGNGTVNKMTGLYTDWLEDNDRTTALNGHPGSNNRGATWVLDNSGSVWGSYPVPTSSVFTVGSDWNDLIASSGQMGGFAGEPNNEGQNVSGEDYAAILFAQKTGICKIGTVNHTSGSDTNVDCGFPNTARFILIRDTRPTYIMNLDWFIFNSGQGITDSTNDYLPINRDNTASAQSGLVKTLSTGFKIRDNSNTGTYLYLAFA